jgi:hypothetical protein
VSLVYNKTFYHVLVYNSAGHGNQAKPSQAMWIHEFHKYESNIEFRRRKMFIDMH